ncbi:expressed unknown protein [Seminavis robusta]|uniref:TFIIH p62 subunit N-terminal domain-containing protein n=1 Tax=Seminavis robusta TaxID=568900 RepID=A0A9N8EDQ7_9STRA|nr:expressed unknown protein [Seminavis robusta]|eukprot:Sro794_g203330.1 n/a (408) ;mRNA; r:5975-7302
MADTETYANVTYKQENGTLTLNDKVFHYQADAPSKTSVKCSWARVEKRQLSPASSKQHMIKMLLVSGKTAVFTVKNRQMLEDLRTSCQAHMEAAKAAKAIEDPKKSIRQSQRDTEAAMDSQRHSSVTSWRDEPVNNKNDKRDDDRDRDRFCAGCCAGTTFCLILICIICLLLAVTCFLIYWFVLKDTDAVQNVLKETGIKDKDRSRPPDVGEESRYGIRAVHHEWDSDEVSLQYELSDYIMDDSVKFILYDGLDCRLSDKDITRDNQWLFIFLNNPVGDGGAKLYNEGRGTRDFEVHFTLNKGQITDAPFFTPNGLDAGRLSFCVGLSVSYNKVDYWEYTEEVNFVERAVQMDIDLSDFRRIDDFIIRTIVRPKYYRRELSSGSIALRGSTEPIDFLEWQEEEETQQ